MHSTYIFLHSILPLIIGHRCIPQFAPENSMSGIIVAKQMNMRGIEVDAMLTKDFVPIIHHDETLERCTGEKGNIFDKTYEELLKYDISHSFYIKDIYKNERIPKMKHFIKRCNELDMILNIEIKCKKNDIITPIIICYNIRKYGNPSNLVISSVNHEALKIAKHMLKNFERNLISEYIPENYLNLMNDLNCTSIVLSHEKNEFDDIIQLLKYKHPVFVYTVNNSLLCKKFISNGIGVFSDKPNIISNYL